MTVRAPPAFQVKSHCEEELVETDELIERRARPPF